MYCTSLFDKISLQTASYLVVSFYHVLAKFPNKYGPWSWFDDDDHDDDDECQLFAL